MSGNASHEADRSAREDAADNKEKRALPHRRDRQQQPAKRFVRPSTCRQSPTCLGGSFALTRTCDIQRLLFSQSRYHIFKADEGFTIQVMNDAVRLSIFLCAFNCEIGTYRAIF